MIIYSKNHFNAYVSSLQSLLDRDGVQAKTSRLQESFSHGLGYKSANGLLADLPRDFSITDVVLSRFREKIREKHNRDLSDVSKIFSALEKEHQTYSSCFGSDQECYPKKLGQHTNYWYLTQDGWVPWSEMNFSTMKVELNIYKVVMTFFAPFLGEGSFWGNTRTIWSADIGTEEFEREANRLEKKYGEFPEQEKWYVVS